MALLGPRAVDAAYLLLHQDDPVALAEHAVRRTLDPAAARREIEAALAANDPELAASFVELARGQGVAVDADLLRRVEAANSAMARTSQAAGSFAHGLVTGEPQDAVGLAGAAAGDLFVFGDIRDALREGRRLASGEQADELLLGLALVGIAVTASAYASLGVGAPARIGVSVIKGARKAGRIGSRLAGEISRSCLWARCARPRRDENAILSPGVSALATYATKIVSFLRKPFLSPPVKRRLILGLAHADLPAR